MKILLVCLGNICRSAMAEGILLDKIKKAKLDIKVDSAGTGCWHAGENPDPRAIATAKKFGVDISKLVARQFTEDDFENFDKIFVMDRSNHRDVLELTDSKEHHNKVDFFLNLVSPGKNLDVPDPWYGGPEGFVYVFKMLDEACEQIILKTKNGEWK